MTELSNSLADLAERIKETHGEFTAAQRMTVEKAFEIGWLLCQAKEQCQHGDWLPLLARSGVGDRWARRLMQLARSGLKSDMVADLGVKGALDYLGNLALPPKGDILHIGRKDPAQGELTSAWIEHSQEHPGNFNVTAIRADGSCVSTSKPARGDTVRCTDGFFNGVWCTLEMVLDIPHEEREFVFIPAEILDDVDDCPFLPELPVPVQDDMPSISKAPLPLSYISASEAVARCETDLSADSFTAMQRALMICEHRSRKWPAGDARMFPTFQRIANDRLSDRIGYLAAVMRVNASMEIGRGAS